MRSCTLAAAFGGLILTAYALPAQAVDLVALSPQTWDRYAPAGKEVDAIYGDFALVNDQIMAIIADPQPSRHANMTVRSIGGCLIDLTSRQRPNDQLSAYYPGGQLRDLKFAGIEVEAPEVYDAGQLNSVFVRAKRVTLKLIASPKEQAPDLEVSYTLEDGWPYVQVTTAFANPSSRAVDADLLDSIRADRTFERSPEAQTDLFWVYDRHFEQAYGFVADDHQVSARSGRGMLIQYKNGEGRVAVSLKPGETYKLNRKVIPGANTFDLRRVASQAAGQPGRNLPLTVKDTAGRPVAGAYVELKTGNQPAYAQGRTDDKGLLRVSLSQGASSLTVSDPARGSKTIEIGPDAAEALAVELPESGVVAAAITNDQGGPIPCKVQFIGTGDTPTPDFGHESGEHAVKNLYYSQNGQFRLDLAPGAYDVIASYGPEYDAIFAKIDVKRGQETPLTAKLVRTVNTEGWISSDFHSHSTPSGDNTSSQYGRVLNLLCEHIEFAPCTEHNRISTYDPHLKRLGVERLMATCTGMELTGKPLPLNHQNAFPLVMRPRTQDGGAPVTADDPELQIERLALWDGGSEKLVQVNHPDMGWMFFDRDGDGASDTGYSAMAGFMDVIEVHPPHEIFGGPITSNNGRIFNNTIVNWLQLLNQGKRIPGVVNTDAHYNFHGSGWLRNYLKSPTDDPAEVKTIDMVHAAERGQLVMSNGPFLEVKLRAGRDGSAKEAGPGEDLAAPSGEAMLHVRVQCPNWFDVDRVQVFVNGRPVESLNFTREQTPDRFSDKTVKFDQDIPIQLQSDAHVIVAAIGERSKLGAVMGPDHGPDKPVAVANPIFVDIDGNGFQANKDKLGQLPVKAR